MPSDLVQRSARGVRVASLAIGAIWFIGLFVNDVVFPLLFARPGFAPLFWPWPGRIVSLAGLAVAFSTFFLARAFKDHHVVDLGLAFEVTTALLIGIVEHWEPSARELRASWISVIIIAYPAIAPASPRKTLVASLLAATMSPVGMAVAWLRGVELPIMPFQYFWLFFPCYIAAGLAVIPAALIRRLSRQVQQARELGSYRLEEMIGSGGMGQVYRATHRLLARPAAVKLIRPETLAGRSTDQRWTTIERFRREAEAAATLRSPHTIELYDFGVTEDGVFYYVMELLDGIDLDELVERFGPLPPERAVHLLRQACDSLGEAHARGLMHRDVKPSNIHTCRMGLTVDFVKLLDFGLVKPQPGQHRVSMPNLTDAGLPGAPGTPAFMAPEAVFGDPMPDHRADIYALGCVAYWLLTGALVFEGPTPARILMQHLEAAPLPPSRLAPSVPKELDDIVLACLSKRPDERPADALRLSERLRACSLQEQWTEERANAWWKRYLPGGVAGGPPPMPEGTDFHIDFGVVSPSVSANP